MPLFGKKKEKTDKAIGEITKAVDNVNVSQQPDVSEQPQDSETEVGIIEQMQRELDQKELERKQLEEKHREQKELELKQLDERQREEKREEVKQEVKQPERPTFAPLFVKLDRYRQILNAIGYLKATMIMIKNSLLTLTELDKAREETILLVVDAAVKLESRIASLDQELIRPSGYHEIITERPEYQDVETVEATVADLKGQIEQLRSELQSMS